MYQISSNSSLHRLYGVQTSQHQSQPPPAANLPSENRATIGQPADEGARLPARETMPLVIRMATLGGRAGGQHYGGGGFLTTARAQRVLESEFNAAGIRIEWTELPSGSAINDVSFRGQVDFAQQGDVAAIAGRVDGQKQRVLMALGSGFQVARYLLVQSDSPFRSLTDLKGRRLGVIKRTASHLTICRILEKNGYGAKDFQLVDFESIAAINSAMMAGNIDGHFTTSLSDPEAQGAERMIYDAGRDPDLSGVPLFWVSQDFEQRFPAIVQRVVNALVETAAWNSDERNRKAAIELWSRSGQSLDAIEMKWAGRLLKEQISPLMDDYFVSRLHQRAVEAKRFGIIDTDLDLNGWIEPKYLERALKDLKLEGYWPERDAERKVKSGSPASHAN